MAVAAEVVFGAYELLEQILLELRLRQLLLSQRINKYVKEMKLLGDGNCTCMKQASAILRTVRGSETSWNCSPSSHVAGEEASQRSRAPDVVICRKLC